MKKKEHYITRKGKREKIIHNYTTEPSYKSKEHEMAVKKAMGQSEKFHKAKLDKVTKYGKHLFGSAITKTLSKYSK